MAIFELDGGRGTLVQPMRPRADSFEVDSSALVSDHVAALLGEQVFPVRHGGSGGPHLLALDAAGRPVVVEVVQQLDEPGLVRALRHAGGSGRLSRSDLARMYHGGSEAFEPELAVFRDRAPILQAQTPATATVRLVVVCADVADGVMDAVDFIAAGAHIEVLRLGVTHGPGGRRYVDVSPLRTDTVGDRRAVEPGPRTGAIQVAPRAAGAAITDPTPRVPEPTTATATATPTRRHTAAEAPAARPAAASAGETTLLPPITGDDVPTPRIPARDDTPLPELAALAAAERGAMDLVWLRVRRGQRLVATLRQDGLIELEDGSVHADPGGAAATAADLETPTDGWRVWRFGDDGPTLGEAVGLPD